jgi:hypothetical protein
VSPELRFKMLRNGYARTRRARKLAKGNCPDCNTPVESGKKMCAKHLANCAAKSKRSYYERKAKGWCVKCGLDKEPGREQVTCLTCSKDRVRRNALRSATRRASTCEQLDRRQNQNVPGSKEPGTSSLSSLPPKSLGEYPTFFSGNGTCQCLQGRVGHTNGVVPIVGEISRFHSLTVGQES